MNNQVYDVDYFIKKFEAIPEDKWFTGEFYSSDRSKACALGQCKNHNERISLEKLFKEVNLTVIDNTKYGFINPSDILGGGEVPCINDGKSKEYQQPTPKQRILAALYDIKSKQISEEMRKQLEKDLISDKVKSKAIFKVINAKSVEEAKTIVKYVTVEIDSKVKELTKQLVNN